jgi:hypothetical protein
MLMLVPKAQYQLRQMFDLDDNLCADKKPCRNKIPWQTCMPWTVFGFSFDHVTCMRCVCATSSGIYATISLVILTLCLLAFPTFKAMPAQENEACLVTLLERQTSFVSRARLFSLVTLARALNA